MPNDVLINSCNGICGEIMRLKKGGVESKELDTSRISPYVVTLMCLSNSFDVNHFHTWVLFTLEMARGIFPM